jgi:squalene-associated FAD-dependent desaturase
MGERVANRAGERVAVVGAGYAGMAAAVTLAARGTPVTVFEAGPLPGGRARRVLSQGHELDNGQHILIGAYSELFRLMRLVGVADGAVLRLPLEIRYFDEFYFRARRLPYRLGLLCGLLLARGVPLAERIGAIRFMAAMQSAKFRLDADAPVELLLKKHRQDGRIGHYLWRPLCVSALNTPPADASAQAFLVVLRDALCGAPGASDLLLPRVDLSRLFPEPAARFVAANGGELRCGVTVRDLSALRPAFHKIIVAVGPHQLKTLMPEAAPEYAYQPIYTCYLQYPAGTALPFPMIGLAGGLVQWVFDRGALTGEQGRLACVISAQGDHQQMTLEEVAELCHRELAAALPGLARPLWSRVIAEKRATIACIPGLRRPSAQTKLPGVFLAGDYTDPEYPPTLEAAVRSGISAANLVA